MGQFYEEIPDDPKLIEWIKEQPMFHVASAPLNGNETISHIYQPGNGRVTILFEAFEGPPRILRLFGQGKVFERGTPEFDAFFSTTPHPDDTLDFPTPEFIPGARAVIWIDIERVGTSCGYSVPLMTFEAHRNVHTKLAEKYERADAAADDPYTLSPEYGLKSYAVAWNTWSIDGLPGVRVGAERATPEDVRKMMVEHGLPPPPSPSKVWAHGKLVGGAVVRLRALLVVGWAQHVLILVIGIVLGALLSTYAQTLSIAYRKKISIL